MLAAAVLSFPSVAANPFILSVGVVIMSYAVLATSWNFVGGFTGYISLGHAAYSGLGAYATGLLVIHTGINPWLCMLGAGLVVAAARGAHRHRQPAGPRRLVRDRLDRAWC